MARKRSVDGSKRGKHGGDASMFDDIDEYSIREEVRGSVMKESSRRKALMPYVVLVLVILAIIGGYFAYMYLIKEDKDTPASDFNEDNSFIADVEIKVETKTDGDGSHSPFDYSMHKVDPSRGTQYLLLIKNKGEEKDSFRLTADNPSGWSVTFEGGNVMTDMSPGYWDYKIMTIKVTDSSDSYRDIKITATSLSDPLVKDSIITKNTVESLPPGEADLNNDPAKVDYNLVYYGGGTSGEKGWYHNQGSEFEATNVIQGFKEAIKGMRVGQTKVIEVPPEKGYGPDDEKHVGGRPLVFEITMLDVNTNN